ncbi:MAG: phosphatidate cytidylyltransferase [Firmicutes bacterium]|nr:phosphatidate cytidylyltransferase [Bacillota bacterium]
MLKRIVSAAVALPIVLILLWLGGYYTMGLIMAVAVMANLEYGRLCRRKGVEHLDAVAILFSLLYIADAGFTGSEYALPITALLIAIAVSMPVLKGNPIGSIPSSAAAVFAPLYFGWTLSHAILLRSAYDGINGFLLVLAILAIVWLHDTAALLVGMASGGRTKLAPLVSPKKSLEGSIGGLLMLIALIFFAYPIAADAGMLPGINFAQKAVLVIIAALCCNYGDLGESALKRDIGVKDSGKFLPGHGGFMDRIDSLLLFVPAAYWLFKHFLGW